MKKLSIMDKFKIGAAAGWEITDQVLKRKLNPIEAPSKLKKNLEDKTNKNSNSDRLKTSSD
jgi:hypothetical protein